MLGRIIGLDVGSRTVGVAVSDPFGWTAQGVDILRIDESKEQFGLEQLKAYIDTYEARTIVIGLPKNMNNTEGPRAEASRRYGELLQQRWQDLSIVFEDERLTTAQAERMLIEEGNVSRKKRQQVIDKLAAVMILQSYLDRQAQQKGRGL